MKHSLKQYNTFNVESYTSNLVIIKNEDDIDKLIQSKLFEPSRSLFIGAGSNLLFLDNVPELVVAMRMQGISYKVNSNGSVVATVSAGVNWHQLVENALSKGYHGLENLALIPGLVGAAPIQNIGAYGVELCDRFISLTAINLVTGEKKVFTKVQCRFAYRDSFFKHSEGRKYLITSVQLSLTTKSTVELSYKALSDAFDNESTITPMMVFNQVCEIRRSKLPDPQQLGNAGSFFKNPIVSSDIYQRLKQQFPDIVAYPQKQEKWKLAAGWMIDKAGLKGYRQNNVGVHTEQALVLVNYLDATGKDIVHLAQYIQNTITELFGVCLEAEVTILDSTGVIALSDAD